MIHIYRFLQLLLIPFVAVALVLRLLKNKEDFSRIKERFGKPSAKRLKTKKLIWIHAASVGESLCVLPVIEKLVENNKLQILLTTGTVTSAKLMAERLPKKVVHQYIPLDFSFFIKPFMNYWRPDLSVFTESDLWPNLLSYAPNKILINARMSDRSLERYNKIKPIAAMLLNGFEQIFAQSEQDYKRFSALTSTKVVNSGNLKYDSKPLSFKRDDYEVFASSFSDRKIMLISSTHPTEDEKFLKVYKNLKKKHNDLFAILVPRHPHRGEEIAQILKNEKLKYIQRTKNRGLDSSIDVYLADTIGEMGLWATLADVVLIGGSLINHGGQSPLDALKAGKPSVCGANMSNFNEMMQVLEEAKVSVISKDLNELELNAAKCLSDDFDQAEFKKQTKKVLNKLTGASKQIVDFVNKRV